MGHQIAVGENDVEFSLTCESSEVSGNRFRDSAKSRAGGGRTCPYFAVVIALRPHGEVLSSLVDGVGHSDFSRGRVRAGTCGRI